MPTDMSDQSNQLIKDVMGAASFGFVTAIDESNQPVMTRVMAYNYNAGYTKVTLFTFEKDAQRLTRILSEGTKIAATISDGMNFKTLQFKGTCEKVYATTPEELEIVKAHNENQRELLASIGVTEESFALWKYEPSVAINMRVEEIFDQTPRVNAGSKIS